jgi:ankyrin repeat protein
MAAIMFPALCKAGTLPKVQAAVHGGISINQRSERGHTGLMLALNHGNNTVADWLLKQANIDTSCQSDVGGTALHYCLMADNLRGLQMLFAHTSCPIRGLNTKTSYGDTPIMLGLQEGSKECVMFLLRLPQVDLNTRDVEGRTLEDIARLAVFTNTFTVLLQAGRAHRDPGRAPEG